MKSYLCSTCGTQYPPSEHPPARCPLCEDERQYVGWKGQQWMGFEDLRLSHRNVLNPEESGLTGIGTQPDFAIAQRAFLVRTSSGNILWDCISLIDDQTIAAIKDLGGISAIAISHPHYYASMVEWAHAFDAPVFLHADDRQWVMRPDPSIEFWQGELKTLLPGITLIRCGGHFDGGTVLHWAGGADGRGALLSGDIINVVSDRRWVSFLYSYPNQIPLSPTAIRRIWAAVEPFRFDRIYGAWWERLVSYDAREAVRRSAERYLRAIDGGALL